MNKSWQILHLSDFHLEAPDGKKEVLRRDHYEEYLRDLFQAIRKQSKDPIDCISVTGDFVDKGRVANYRHAQEVINVVLHESGLSEKSVVVCPGNHDLVHAEEKKGRESEARKDYHLFAQNWANGKAVEKMDNARACLCEIKSDLWVLSIDSTMGALAPLYGPGKWCPDEDPDEPIRWVKARLKQKNELLVVLSHYPVEELQGSLVPDEEENFHVRHIWVKGRELSKRIGNWRSPLGEKTLWLSGDIHVPHRASSNGVEFVTAGRFGARPGNDGQQPRQAKLIQIYNDANLTKVTTFNYEMPGMSTALPEERGMRVATPFGATNERVRKMLLLFQKQAPQPKFPIPLPHYHLRWFPSQPLAIPPSKQSIRMLSGA